MKKIPFIIALLFFVLVVSKSVLVVRGMIHGGPLQSVGVSSNGTIFVGYRGIIEVFQNKSISFTFRPPTSRNYRFFIENDKLIIGRSTGGSLVYDMCGNYVEEGKLSYNKVKSAARKRDYELENGDKYTLERFGGLKPFEIKCNDETIIRQSKLDYCLNGLPFWLFFGVTFINMAIIVLIVVEKIGFQ